MRKEKIFISLFLAILLISLSSAFEFCEDGTKGEENLRLVSVDDMLDDNTKEWLWQPGEEIEIETRVENKDDDTDTFILEITAVDENDDEVKLIEDEDGLKKEFTMSSKERKTISIKFEVEEDLDAGEYKLHVKFYKKTEEDSMCVENSEEEFKIEKIDLCEEGSVSKGDLEITEISDSRKDNENKWEWAPGNNVEIIVNLENKEYEKRTFEVELIMLDENNNEVKFAEDPSELKDDLEIEENEEDEIDFYFKIDNSLEEGFYTLYAKAYDENDDEICTSQKAEKLSDPITLIIEKEPRKIIISKIDGESIAEQGGSINYTVTVSNLGSKDEEKVSVMMYNYKLEIKEIKELDDLESGEERILFFEASVKNDASLEMHRILFSAEYEYDDRLEYYKSTTEDEDGMRGYLTILKAEEDEPEPIIEELLNQTIENENLENSENSIITGNVVESSEKSAKWFFIILTFLVIGGLVIFAFLKKDLIIKVKDSLFKKKRPTGHHLKPIKQANITRVYKAKL